MKLRQLGPGGQQQSDLARGHHATANHQAGLAFGFDEYWIVVHCKRISMKTPGEKESLFLRIFRRVMHRSGCKVGTFGIASGVIVVFY